MIDDVQNVILLSLDALRADHLSCYGYARDTSPTLDELAADNLMCANAFSASSHTREAVASLLTGEHPNRAAGTNYQLAAEPISSVAQRAGLTRGGFHSNPFVSRAYGFDEGFDVFDDDLHLGQHKIIALAQRVLDKLRNRHYARAKIINERAFKWLDSLEDVDRFFLWNHYMDTHGPYEPPAEYRERYTDEYISDRTAGSLYKRAIKDPESITDAERKLLVDYYDAEIRYIDDRLAEFFESLRRRDLLDDSLVIITADHGDAFGEHDYYEHPRQLHEELVHVPLIVVHPDIEPATIETAVSTTDIAATISQVLGEPPCGVGESLFDLPHTDGDRTVFQQARGENESAHIRRFAARTKDEAAYGQYDTNTETMTVDSASSDAIGEALLSHIREQSATSLSEDAAEEAPNEEIEQRLSALGYK
jgi:arylsulfatase